MSSKVANRRVAFQLYEKFHSLQLVADILGVTTQRVRKFLEDGTRAGEFTYRPATRNERLKQPCLVCGRAESQANEVTCNLCLSDLRIQISLVDEGSLSLEESLTMMGLEWVDNRPKGGALWVLGSIKIGKLLAMFTSFGYNFTYRPRSARAYDKRSGWFLSSQPVKERR